MSKYKIVILEIRVPDNDFCWDGHTPCEHFDNEGGYLTCKLFSIPYNGYPSDPFIGYRKPKECLELKERRLM